jgi:hypothetical protein
MGVATFLALEELDDDLVQRHHARHQAFEELHALGMLQGECFQSPDTVFMIIQGRHRRLLSGLRCAASCSV